MLTGEDTGVLAAPQAEQPDWEDHSGRGSREAEEKSLYISCSSDTGLPTSGNPPEGRAEPVYPGPSVGPATG